ncbi:MAG: hypothetical protein IPI49_02920 [Myxococcales bacterium]|nr:hypothetical protein [Myxococcales bacterium]
MTTAESSRVLFMVLSLVGCGGTAAVPPHAAPSTHAASSTQGAPSTPAAPRQETRLWRLRDQVLRAPADLALEQRSACLAEDDPRFEGLFVGGQTQILTLRASASRIEAWQSCAGDSLISVFIYPHGVEDLRYFVSYVEAGISIDVRADGMWARACDEDKCKPGRLAQPEQAFWAAQWEKVSLIDDLSADAAALEAAILSRAKSAPR